MKRILIASTLVFLAGCATTQPSANTQAGAPAEWKRRDVASARGEAVSEPHEWVAWNPIDDTPVSSLPESLAIDGNEDLDDHEGATLDTQVAHADSTRPLTAEVEAAGARRAKTNGTKTGRFVAASAARWVGLKSLRRVSTRVPDDCSGLVRLSYHKAGLDPVGYDGLPGDNAVTAMWRRSHRLGALKRGAPKPGDLVFFRNTWDRNGDGQRNDGLTHVGVVESVDAYGTVSFVHRSGQGVNRMRLNTRHPSAKSAPDGRTLNDHLRRPDGTNGPRLTGELFAGYASVKAFKADQLRAARGPVAKAK